MIKVDGFKALNTRRMGEVAKLFAKIASSQAINEIVRRCERFAIALYELDKPVGLVQFIVEKENRTLAFPLSFVVGVGDYIRFEDVETNEEIEFEEFIKSMNEHLK